MLQQMPKLNKNSEYFFRNIGNNGLISFRSDHRLLPWLSADLGDTDRYTLYCIDACIVSTFVTFKQLRRYGPIHPVSFCSMLDLYHTDYRVAPFRSSTRYLLPTQPIRIAQVWLSDTEQGHSSRVVQGAAVEREKINESQKVRLPHRAYRDFDDDTLSFRLPCAD